MAVIKKKKKRKLASGTVEACCDGEGGSTGDMEHGHPDHSYVLPRLSRVQGQVAGIEKMIRDRRYCIEILVQFRAAMAAMRNLEVEVFGTHLRHCVADAVRLRDPKEVDKKIEELTDLLVRRTQI